MKSYPAYKHSGVPWLGEIPEHWGIERLRKFCFQVKDKNSALSTSRALQFRYGEIIEKPNNDDTDSDYLKTISDYTLIRPNNIVINGLNLNYDFVTKRVAISNMEGAMTSAYIALGVDDNIIPKYLSYLLKGLDERKMFNGMGKGIRITLTFKILSQLCISSPPLSEQAAIASYLDRKCGEIDEMVRRRQAIIERLRELKQALIAKAVTKGLHPDVPMKDSGILWLGQIPEHWKIERLKQFCFQIKDRNSDLCTSRALQFRYGEIIEKPNNDETNADYLKTISDYTLIRPNYIIINGLNLNYDFVTQRVAISNMDGAMTSAYIAMGVHNNIIPRYLSYLLKSLDAKKMLNGMGKGIRITLTFKILSQLCISSPPLPEQAAIVAYLDKKCAAIDELISRHGQIVEKLRELKASAIAHVVTGKIDIREGA